LVVRPFSPKLDFIARPQLCRISLWESDVENELAEGIPFEPILPFGDNGHKGGFAPSLEKAAGDARSHFLRDKMTRTGLAGRLGVSLSTLKNWGRGRTKPAKQFWPGIRSWLAN
jgi:hypothetical protein